MTHPVNSLKFHIAPTGNAAQRLISTGFIPNGEARKNGWEEIADISDTIKLAVTGLFKSVSSLAGDCVKLGGNDEPLVVNTYKSLQSDVEITVNSMLEIDKSWEGKSGMFRNPEESSLAMQTILDYQNVFERTRSLTDGMMAELGDIAVRLAKDAAVEQPAIEQPAPAAPEASV